MHCPFCKTDDTKVIDSRLSGEGTQVRRRRQCIACHERFTTHESVELAMPWIIKSDGRREAFDPHKLSKGMLRALEKRPVSQDAIDKAIGDIQVKIYALAEKEISSRLIGDWVMAHLQFLDAIAYIRFASVYHHFETLEMFKNEIDRLQRQRMSSEAAQEAATLAHLEGCDV